MAELIYKEESYRIIGKCFEVHKHLGGGFSEVVYKDALEYEFEQDPIEYARNKIYPVHYKGILLPHTFEADFVVFNKIILVVKGVKELTDEDVSRTLNYLAVSKNRLGLLVNFARGKLVHKRLVM